MSSSADESFSIRIGPEELVIRKRYEALSIANDVLVGVWFLIGSIMFFSPSWTTTGTCLFVVGSAELLIRPVIRLARHVHLGKIGANSLARAGQPDQEY